MHFFRIFLVAVAIPCFALASPDLTSAGSEEDRRLAEAGVHGYRINLQPDAITADLHDDVGRFVATIRVLWEHNRRTLLRWKGADASSFEVTFDAALGELVLALPNGDRFAKTFDLVTKKFVATALAEEAIAAHKVQIVAMAIIASKGMNVLKASGTRLTRARPDYSECTSCPATLDDTDTNDADPSSPPPGGPGSVVGPGWYLGCSSEWLRGEAFGSLSRSQICELAKQDVTSKCNSGLCFGCCAYSDCDAFCMLDDYLCVVAGVSGRYCIRIAY